MNLNIRIVLGAFFVFCGVWQASAQEGSVTGLWLTQKGDARIQITNCGPGICGKVVWLKDAIDPETKKPMTDSKNPNASLASRPMVGVQLFIGMNPTGPGSWAGRIYNADDGGVYDSKVKVLGPGSLQVEGCLGAFCGGETWTKLGGR